MQLHINPAIRVPAPLLRALVQHGFAGVTTDDVEALIRAAPSALRRWVRICHDPVACSRPIDFRTATEQGHTAPTPRTLSPLDASVHAPPRQVAIRPRYPYTGRVRDRHRHGTTHDNRFLVSVRIPADPETGSDDYPRVSRDPRRRDTPAIQVENWREEVVRLVAHEARHVHQHRHGLPRSEADAERWAQARLQEYRQAREHVVAVTALGR